MSGLSGDTYASQGWDMCVSCPEGATSNTRNTDLEDCKCESGRGSDCISTFDPQDFSSLHVLNITMVVQVTNDENVLVRFLAEYPGLNVTAIEVISSQQRSEDEMVITIIVTVPTDMVEACKAALQSPSWSAFLDSQRSQPQTVEQVNIQCKAGAFEVEGGGCEDCQCPIKRRQHLHLQRVAAMRGMPHKEAHLDLLGSVGGEQHGGALPRGASHGLPHRAPRDGVEEGQTDPGEYNDECIVCMTAEQCFACVPCGHVGRGAWVHGCADTVQKRTCMHAVLRCQYADHPALLLTSLGL